MSGHEKRRPGQEAANLETTTPHSTRCVVRLADLEARAARVDFAILVLSERVDGVVCQQLYTNLKAAERKVARTRERNLSACMTLVRLDHVSGWVA